MRGAKSGRVDVTVPVTDRYREGTRLRREPALTVAAPPPVLRWPNDEPDSSFCIVHRAELLVLRSKGHSLVHCEQCDPFATGRPEISCLWPG